MKTIGPKGKVDKKWISPKTMQTLNERKKIKTEMLQKEGTLEVRLLEERYKEKDRSVKKTSERGQKNI